MSRAVSGRTLQEELSRAGTRLVSLLFYVTRCAPCRKSAFPYEKLVQRHPSVVFLRANVEGNSDLVKQYDIQLVPTVVLIRKRKVVATLCGLCDYALSELIERHMPEDSEFSGKKYE
ncbi:thioredoxin-like [Schistocerca gregaria]|uniref:thioredoxin-like n=1 Tax=Schistocerca gregaria TaxID=7010 RepID=UPI00211EFC93|nr:thioredoxin-like [Schistocerca gregaria]